MATKKENAGPITDFLAPTVTGIHKYPVIESFTFKARTYVVNKAILLNHSKRTVFVVSDYITGYAVAHGRIKKNVIKRAKEKINSVPNMNDFIKKQNLMPVNHPVWRISFEYACRVLKEFSAAGGYSNKMKLQAFKVAVKQFLETLPE